MPNAPITIGTIVTFIIIVVVVLLLREFFTSANADGLSLEFKWQQVLSIFICILADLNKA